jgi:hypothetical protein
MLSLACQHVCIASTSCSDSTAPAPARSNLHPYKFPPAAASAAAAVSAVGQSTASGARQQLLLPAPKQAGTLQGLHYCLKMPPLSALLDDLIQLYLLHLRRAAMNGVLKLSAVCCIQQKL